MPHDHAAFDFAAALAETPEPASKKPGLLTAFKEAGRALVARAKNGAAAKVVPFVLAAISAFSLAPQAKAQSFDTIYTLTGKVQSGTDTGSQNVFGAGSSLGGQNFTLTVTYDATLGTNAFGLCNDGSGNAASSSIRGDANSIPATATLQIGGGPPVLFMGSGESGDYGWASRTAIACGSSSSTAGVAMNVNAGGIQYTFGPGNFAGDIFPPSGQILSPSGFWSDNISPPVATDPTKTIGFNVLAGGGNVKNAGGNLAPSTLSVTQAGIDLNALTNGSGCDCKFGWDNPYVGILSQSQDLGQSAAKDFKKLVGDPINPASGNVFEAATDYETAGPNALAFRRSYNSFANQIFIAPPLNARLITLASELGSNWRSNFDGFLQIGSTIVSAERPDGQVIPFRLNGTTWTPPAGIDATLTQSGTAWTLTLPDDLVETYSTAATAYGLLQSIQQRNGYTQTLAYNGSHQLSTVTDSYSRQIAFSYSGGLLQSITTPDSTTISYGYTAAGGSNVLTSVSYPTTPATSLTYQYNQSGQPFLLTGIQDAAGNQVAAWTYDSQQRATSSKHGGTLGADLTTVAYNADGSVTVTNALGVADTYSFANFNGVHKLTKISRAATSTTAAASRSFAYDINGYLISETDWNGNLKTYVNNGHGQATSVTEASGATIARTTTTLYDTTFIHLPKTITMPGLTVGFTYDGGGNPLTKTETDTTTTTVPYSTNGQARITQWTWNSTGEMLTLQLPRTDVTAKTTFGYSSDGALTSITDALSHQTQITSHTLGGRPLTVQDPNGVVMTNTYDGGQRLMTSSIATGAGNLTTSWTFDTAGNLTSVQKPDGSKLTYGYDAADRLTSVADLFGNSVSFTLDALGDKTQTRWKDTGGTVQRSTTATFDALGRILTNVGGMSQTTTFTYDKNSNVLTVKDGDNNTVTNTYDALNRVHTAADPSPGSFATYTYDAHNRVTKVNDPIGNNTTYVYDGFGDRIQTVSPDSGTTVFTYDKDRNLTQRVMAGSLTANFTWDALDRNLTVSYPSDSTLNVSKTYDQATGHGFGIGRLTSATDQPGSLSLTYDERGNATQESRTVTGAGTLNTTTAFDAGNNISSITYPSGTVVGYGRDSMGRVTSVTAKPPGAGSPSNVATSVTYEPFGPVTGLTFGNGITGTYAFDADYRATSRVEAGTSNVLSLAYTYDAADNVKTITDSVNAANSQTLTYDALNRLKTAVSGTGGYGSWSWTWDAVSNVKTQVVNGTTTSINEAGGSNKLANSVTGGTTTSATDTAAGNINLLKIGSTTIETLTWNQANQMASAATTSSSATYAYGLDGQRIEKTRPGSNPILYQYGQAAKELLSESDLHAGQTADYIYLNGKPIGEVNPTNGKIYFMHTDHLGTPDAVTDSTKAVVWTAIYNPFGDNPIAGVSGTLGTQSLRLPGQQFDPETGYNHNGFRDYAGTLTRYVASDPIGLAGGMNTYQYVRGNPFKAIDPRGLDSETVSSVGVGPGDINPNDTVGFGAGRILGNGSNQNCAPSTTGATPSSNPLAWLDPKSSYQGVSEIATGVGIANMGVGDLPGGLAAFAFAALMDAQGSFFTPAWQTGVSQGGAALFSISFDSFGLKGQFAGWAASTFVNWYMDVVSPLFTRPSNTPPGPVLPNPNK